MSQAVSVLATVGGETINVSPVVEVSLANKVTTAQERFHAAIGVKIGEPVDIIASGQSNFFGQGESDLDTTVEDGILVGNHVINSTSFITPAFDAPPFSNVGTPEAPTQNAPLHMANELRRSGLVHPSSTIRIIPNWQGGQSIDKWILGHANENLFTSLIDSISALGVTRVPLILWGQGEANSDASSADYSTKATYAVAHRTLRAQYRALSQVADDARFIILPLGQWHNNTQGDRNDALFTIPAEDRFAHIIDTSDMSVSESGESNHYTGADLIQAGQRLAHEAIASYLGSSGATHQATTAGLPASSTNGAGAILTGGTTSLTLTDVLTGYSGAVQGPHTINVPTNLPASGHGVTLRVLSASSGSPVTISSASQNIVPATGTVGQASYSIEAPGLYKFAVVNGALTEGIGPQSAAHLASGPTVAGLLSNVTVNMTPNTDTDSGTLSTIGSITNDASYPRTCLVSARVRTLWQTSSTLSPWDLDACVTTLGGEIVTEVDLSGSAPNPNGGNANQYLTSHVTIAFTVSAESSQAITHRVTLASNNDNLGLVRVQISNIKYRFVS